MIRNNDPRRCVFAELCAMMFPAWEHMPGAAGLNLENRQLDIVCQVRPDIESALLRILNNLSSPVRRNDIQTLEDTAPEDFQALSTAVFGAYYMHPTVKRALGYDGQQALSLPRAGFGAEELVIKMMARPKCYRPVTNLKPQPDTETT